jgi:hypothetical protein
MRDEKARSWKPEVRRKIAGSKESRHDRIGSLLCALCLPLSTFRLPASGFWLLFFFIPHPSSLIPHPL